MTIRATESHDLSGPGGWAVLHSGCRWKETEQETSVFHHIYGILVT